MTNNLWVALIGLVVFGVVGTVAATLIAPKRADAEAIASYLRGAPHD